MIIILFAMRLCSRMILNGDTVQVLLGERLVAINFDHNRCKIMGSEMHWETLEFFCLETRKRHLFSLLCFTLLRGLRDFHSAWSREKSFLLGDY